MSNIQHYKYMVVEDESMIRRNIIKKIESLGLPIELYAEASNGMDAMILIEKSCPDLIITDIQMPQCDGLELVRFLSKNHPHVKTIIISGYEDFSYAQSAIRHGVSDYILKPIAVDSLYSTLNKLLIIMNSEHHQVEHFQTDINKMDQKSIYNLLEAYFLENYCNEISLLELSNKFGFTQEYLGKIFKKHSGMPPSKYLMRLRINEAKRLLSKYPEMDIQKVGELVGYKDGFYFSRVFKNYTGIQPSEFRNK